MAQIQFNDNLDQDYYAHVEVVDANTVRIITMQREVDTRYRSVRDIHEMPVNILSRVLGGLLVQYKMDLLTDVKLPFDVDLGATRSVSGYLKKIQLAAPRAVVCEYARKDSENGYVQHVNYLQGETYVVSDWYDGSTVASFENGREL